MKFKHLTQYLLALLFVLGGPVYAQTDCGVLPEKPSIVDGSTATMEELVAALQADNEAQQDATSKPAKKKAAPKKKAAAKKTATKKAAAKKATDKQKAV